MLSLNLHRRHLTESQRAMVGGRAKDAYARQAKERQKRKPSSFVPVNSPEQKGETRDKIGKVVGVSGWSIDYARKVLAGGRVPPPLVFHGGAGRGAGSGHVGAAVEVSHRG